MRRYDVPRLAFINKCDRSGADPIRVLNQMREKLRLNCSPVQLTLGLEDKLTGLIDVVEQKAFNFGGPFGNEITQVTSLLPLLLHQKASILQCCQDQTLSLACKATAIAMFACLLLLEQQPCNFAGTACIPCLVLQ